MVERQRNHRKTARVSADPGGVAEVRALFCDPFRVGGLVAVYRWFRWRSTTGKTARVSADPGGIAEARVLFCDPFGVGGLVAVYRWFR